MRAIRVACRRSILVELQKFNDLPRQSTSESARGEIERIIELPMPRTSHDRILADFNNH